MTDREHPAARSERHGPDQRVAAPGGPSLRAALLALGLGVLWAALSRWRRRGPADLW
jgi:hypothetical protein